MEVHIGQKVNIGPRSTTKMVFLKFSIFIRFTWNLKRSFIFGHWIQPPIIFEFKFVFWNLQVLCSAQSSSCYSVCLSVCLSHTGHNFKPIFMKLHHMVEFVRRKKPIVWGEKVKRSTLAKGQQLRWDFQNPQFLSNWLEIWRGFIFHVTEFN